LRAQKENPPEARADFEAAWRVFLSKRSEADFQEWRGSAGLDGGEVSPL
jgi:hypothetical protein